jgi:hypothetical protein
LFNSKNAWICCHIRYENLEFLGEYIIIRTEQRNLAAMFRGVDGCWLRIVEGVGADDY